MGKISTEACGGKKPLTHMVKAEIQEELNEYQAEYDRACTVTELRALLREHRDLDPAAMRRDERLKGLQKRTINQLRADCTKYNIPFEMKDIRGILMLKLRRYCADNPINQMPLAKTKLKFGRHAGKEF